MNHLTFLPLIDRVYTGQCIFYPEFDRGARDNFLGLKFDKLLFFGVAQNEGYLFVGGGGGGGGGGGLKK